MKKRMAALLAILLLFPVMLPSCGLEADDPSETMGVARLVTTDYPVKTARTPHVTGSTAPEISVIQTRAELIRYVSVYEKCYDFLDETAEMFYDIVSGYKEDYFASQALGSGAAGTNTCSGSASPRLPRPTGRRRTGTCSSRSRTAARSCAIPPSSRCGMSRRGHIEGNRNPRRRDCRIAPETECGSPFVVLYIGV